MATFLKLDKFVDSRGWSINDIYNIAKAHMRMPDAQTNDECKSPYDYQINYSVLYPGVVKAWHRHKFQDDYFCILQGMAQVGVYSKDKGAEKFFIGEHNPGIVHVEAGEWHGLTCVGNQPCGLLYLVTKEYMPHNPDEERCSYPSFVGHQWWKPENK